MRIARAVNKAYFNKDYIRNKSKLKRRKKDRLITIVLKNLANTA